MKKKEYIYKVLSKCSLARIYDTDMRSPSVSVRTLPQSPARALTCPIWKDMSFGSKDFSRRCATTSSIYDRFFDYLPRWSLSLWERRLYLRPGGETHIESVSEPALWCSFSHFEPERWTLTCIWQFLEMLEMQLLQQFLDLTYVIMTYLNQNAKYLQMAQTL